MSLSTRRLLRKLERLEAMQRQSVDVGVQTMRAARCKACNRVLLDAESIARGYGPECFERAMMPSRIAVNIPPELFARVGGAEALRELAALMNAAAGSQIVFVAAAPTPRSFALPDQGWRIPMDPAVQTALATVRPALRTPGLRRPGRKWERTRSNHTASAARRLESASQPNTLIPQRTAVDNGGFQTSSRQWRGFTP